MELHGTGKSSEYLTVMGTLLLFSHFFFQGLHILGLFLVLGSQINVFPLLSLGDIFLRCLKDPLLLSSF